MSTQSRSLLVVTNIPSPYRSNFFNYLALELQAHDVALLVAYCAKREWHRHWPYKAEENRYRHIFLRGYALKLGALTFHFNPGIATLIRRERPDWLLSAGAWNMPTGLLALMSRPQLTQPIFWSEGHHDAVINRTGVIARLRSMILRRYCAFAVPNCRSGDFVRDQVGWIAPCLSLPNTVDDRFFTPLDEESRKELRTKLGIGCGERVLLKVSRLEHRKGVLETCEAFSRIVSERTSLRLVLVGTGTQESELRTRFAALIASGRLSMPGNLDREAVREWLRAADAFLLMSRRDPNPLSAIEAALCGVPLILSRFVGNAVELLGNGSAEWIVPEVEVGVIAARLRHFARCSDELLKMHGAAGLRRAQSGFQTTEVARRFVSELLEMRANH